MAQQTALQKAIEEIKSMAGEFENQRIPAVLLLSKIIPLLEDEKKQTEILDEEIEKSNPFRIDGGAYNSSAAYQWLKGAKWYREQLKNK